MGQLFITILFLVVEVGAQSAAQTTAASGKTPSPPPLKAPTMPVQSNASSVFELLRTRHRFENDGTGRNQVTARIRILNEMGVRQRSGLTFDYKPFTERLEIPYVRVVKKNGSVVNIAKDEVVQRPTVTAGVPEFDYDEKRLQVPGLSPGDALEYEVVTVIQRPLAPGQFWAQHNFRRIGVLDEQLEVDTPKGRVVKVKSIPGIKTWETGDNKRIVHHWRNVKPAGQIGAFSLEPGRTPDVQVSSFLSWEEVGRWYEELERSRGDVWIVDIQPEHGVAQHIRRRGPRVCVFSGREEDCGHHRRRDGLGGNLDPADEWLGQPGEVGVATSGLLGGELVYRRSLYFPQRAKQYHALRRLLLRPERRPEIDSFSELAGQ
jgi:hypothetical protein